MQPDRLASVRKRSAISSSLIILAGLLLLAGCRGIYHDRPVAKNGVLDLRNWSFEQKTPLNGQWQFNWKQLVTPGSPTPADTLVSFPYKWNGQILRNETLPSFGYATYRLTLLLPHNITQLRLAMPETYSAYRLYINGKETLHNGRVATNAKDFEAHWQYQNLDLPLHSDTIHLILQIANFVHSKGGISKPIFVGRQEMIELDRQHAAGIDLLLTGCLFMGGLFFLGLYLLGNRDKAILLFSLYSIVYSYRIIGTDNYVLHTILPHLDWYITARLEYLTLFFGIGLFGLYTRYIYPQDANRVVVNVINFCCLAFTGCALLLPPYLFTQLVNPFLAVMFFCLFYVPLVYLRAYKNRRPGSLYALLSAVALMGVFAISLFNYWGMIPPLQLLSFTGYVGFFFFQSLVLSHRVSFVLRKAREQAELGLVAKSEFLSTMSHEIRTPLNSVIGMSHLLLRNNPRPDQVEQLNVMLFSANNLLAIVNDVLDYNKIEAGKVTFERIDMDVAAIAANIVKGLENTAQDKGIMLNLKADTALQTSVIGDPTRFTQVLTNLVHNAIKFTPSGSVRVTVDVVKETDKHVSLQISVKDTGIGIAKEKQQLIFERFTQADSSTSRGFGGTGLGLAITKRLLALQNAPLHLISEEGQGAEFYFVQTFEKSRKKPAPVTTLNAATGSKPLSNIPILLVEDNPMNVMVAQNFLKRWGAIVDVAVNGQEALDKLDISRHRLILMDLQMPIMDGYEAAKRMRAVGVKLPIIALTANLPKEVEEQANEAGMNGMVAKPFLPDELLSKILQVIAG